jgi:catechol 2,3-dioxygenase-like lactoylglutathione lyase family enzyme
VRLAGGKSRAQAAETMFRALHPILGTRDLERALNFYIGQLGFELAFRDPGGPANYAGVRREQVELHLQWQHEHEMATTRLRFLVTDPDRLSGEYEQRQVQIQNPLKSTPWGTREFALYDPDRNALTFYRDLSQDEVLAHSRRTPTVT